MGYRTIQLKGRSRYEEKVTAAAILPGQALRITDAGQLNVHNVEGGGGLLAIATEDALSGKTINDAATIGEVAPYILPQKGDVVNVLLAVGEDVDIGDHLISDGQGNFIAVDSASSAVTSPVSLVQAEEALDLSGSGAVATHIAAVVL